MAEKIEGKIFYYNVYYLLEIILKCLLFYSQHTHFYFFIKSKNNIDAVVELDVGYEKAEKRF